MSTTGGLTSDGFIGLNNGCTGHNCKHTFSIDNEYPKFFVGIDICITIINVTRNIIFYYNSH